MSEQSQYHFCLERIEFGLGIEIDGWAFHETYGACRLRVFADGHPLPGECGRFDLPREDVSVAFNNRAAKRCGFRLAAHLPAGARSIVLQFDGRGGEGWLPILERVGDGARSWVTVARPGPEEPQYRFLTERGVAFAAATAGGGRLGAALAQFGTATAPPPGRPVSIVVPVYGGKRYLHTLAQTLLERTDPRHPIILVDDGNADRTISAFLVALRATSDRFTLVQMPENAGYIGASAAGVAQALRRNPDGHVIILNTDVEVPRNWVERLIAPLEADPRVASATPFTNAGTICGFPSIPDDNPAVLGADVQDIDAEFATLTAPPFGIPTGVGFCMAYSRRALATLGFFDAAAFGRGYGEEVDWCRRAENSGFVNVLVPNLFVRHKHGGSFVAGEKAALIERSGAIIRQRYPTFDAEVQDFLAADPAAPLRAAALVRLWARLGGPGAVLVFDHGASGGAIVVRQREVARRLEEGRLVVLVQPAVGIRPGMPEAAIRIEILCRDAAFRLEAQDLSDLRAVAEALPLTEILINSFVRFERHAALMAFVGEQRRARRLTVRMLHNDYYPICPSLNLIDADDRYCAVPRLERCGACALRNRHMEKDTGVGGGVPDVAAHRRAWQDLLAIVDHHVFFSRTSLEVMRRAFPLPDEKISVLPHLAEHVEAVPLPPAPVAGGVRVAIIGGINTAKGSGIVAEMVALAEAHRLPVVFELFGNSDRRLESPCFHDNGPYEPAALAGRLEARGCNVVFLPSIWPETHCYVLDEVIGLGRPVGVFDLGAPAERIRFWPNGFVVTEVSAAAALTAILKAVGIGVVNDRDGGIYRQ